jgi:hypothetical protein
MKYTYSFFILFLLLPGFHSNAQSITPEVPPLYYVTVDPETGYDIIVWYSSPSDFTDYYKVITSVIVNPDESPQYMEIGTVYAPDTVFYYSNSDSYSSSIGYTVVAVNDLGGGSTTIFRGLYDAPDSTIFLESVFDSCQATITLSWNDYNKWRGSIAGYNIRQRMGPNDYITLATLNEGINTFVLRNIQVNQQYDLFIEAVHSDGIRSSTSNRIGVFTQMSRQPGYVNADYATISPGNFIDLSFSIVGASDLTSYNLMRSTNPTGPYTLITTFDTPDAQIKYTDEIRFTSNIYYYRLDIVNNCGQIAAGSNLANNIILSGRLTNMNATLQWNDYSDWSGGLDQYRIIRERGRHNPVVDTLNIGKITFFSDDISQLVNYQDPESSLICYEVLATENLNVYGIQGKSLSNKVCFSIKPDIRMPNAFIPNDTEPMNQVFEPVFSFLPEHYNMIIYNRLGTKVWEGSQAWDGRVNGKYVPEGIYLYYLKVYNYSTDIIELNGKVTVVYR